MAKRRKVLPATKAHRDESLLLQSAESLGRMIGSLQRQLDDATKRLPARSASGFRIARDGDGTKKPSATRTGRPGTTARAPQPKAGSKSGTTRIQSTADRKSKRASKSAAAKKTAGRSRSGASRRGRKAARHA